ncbi:hypothetical protein PIB30_091361 [Stylosanthes scabra]|uniref:Uncharacterized protein n=1 Tax=Stylosanthes scabra TaxID=79078 RepID=A0ABU6VT23_9FABA|nr:hypothetical protein [Stylosanthes scabra]
MTLGTTEAAADHWCEEWKTLAAETEKIDPKGKRIYDPKKEAGESSEPLVVVQPEQLGEPQQLEMQLGGRSWRRRCRKKAGNCPFEFACLVAAHLPGDQPSVVPRSLGRPFVVLPFQVLGTWVPSIVLSL